MLPLFNSLTLSLVKIYSRLLPTLSFIFLGIAGLTALQAREIPLWPNGLPNGQEVQLEEIWQERPIEEGANVTLDRSVKAISTPTMTVYRPEKQNQQRSSIVILPGGGFSHLAIDKEDHDIARWLNTHGITGIVVKYPVIHEQSNFHVYNSSVPDSLRAIRQVRHQAKDWNLDPNKVGVMGFSAGGYLTAVAGTLYNDGNPKSPDPIERMSCRPNFIAPIYPLIEIEDRVNMSEAYKVRMFGQNATSERIHQFSPIKHVTSSTPPTFLVHAHDDNLSSQNSARFYLALLESDVSTELHVYSKGGHGYGMRQRGLPLSSWRERFADWMKFNDFR